MLVRLRREYAGLVTSGGQLALLMLGLHLDSREGWMVSVALMALLSMVAWTSAFRRARAVADTPTSKVASAAQGYVELRGVGRAFGGLPLLSPLTSLPCLWYRYIVERKTSENKWVVEQRAESDASFILDDGSGQCVVDPDGAEMLVHKKDHWTRDDRRYTQWLLIERQPIYALGHFATRGSADLQLDADADVKALLAEWKREPARLLARFDRDGNGQIDLQEWEHARREAKREVAANHRELHSGAELHVLHAPADDRLYLISDLDPDRLAAKYRFWSWAHLAIFFGALVALALIAF